MKKLLILIGDSAVGKMTVGQELMKITNLKLFHNHMTIELVLEIFGKFDRKIINQLRELIFEEFSKSDCEGMIYTYMWAFDMKSDWDHITHVCDIFERENYQIYFAELVAPQDVRLQRNSTENRLKHKPSKRDIEISNRRLITDDTHHRCVSDDGEIPFKNYIKIDNSNLAPDVLAKKLKEKFSL